MNQILLVDDDAVIVQIYRRKFVQAGYDVQVAGDGLAAMKLLSSGLRPHAIILDLMMPKMSGVDVLKFVRARPELKDLCVIIFSNAYMTDLVQAAAVAGADKALLKSRCPPAVLVETVNQMLAGGETPEGDTILLATPDHSATSEAAEPEPPPFVLPPSPPRSVDLEVPAPEAPKHAPDPVVDSHARAREDFIGHSAATLKTIRGLVQAFLECKDPVVQQMKLLDAYRKAHFVTTMAGMAGCKRIAQFVSAFEALLFELHERPAHINPSAIQTIKQSIEFLAQLFEQPNLDQDQELPQSSVLVVDDDTISNRLIVTALKRAELRAFSEGNPVAALRMLQSYRFDLVLLDISMPELDGFQVCTELRKLPAYEKTPVIFVTCHSDFESRSKSVVSGGNDLIAKPILPIELAVKAVTHLLRARLPA